MASKGTNSTPTFPGISLSWGDGYKKDNGEATIFAIVYVNRKKVRFNTGLSVLKEEFDSETWTVLPTHEYASDYNLILGSVKARLNEIFIRYRLQHRSISPALLRKEYKAKMTSLDFHSFLKNAIEERKGEITHSSIKQHRVLAANLREFSPDLSFIDLQDDFFSRYNRWLISTKGNSTNTRYNNFKNLKAYMNIAKRSGLIQVNPLDFYMPVRMVQSDRSFLTEDQVRALQALYIKNILGENDKRILRHFLFMCFTGLRISDLKNIQMEDISKDLLVFTAYKTRGRKPASLKIPLCSYAKQLIKDESPHRIHGHVFNCFAEATMRRRIKEIVKAAGIHIDISLHTGRHTFATMFLRRTKNITALQKLLGHTKIEMTLVYAHILTEDIVEEIHNAFDSF